MAPRRTAAAAGAARSTSSNQRHPAGAVQELQAGLHLLQEPFSDAAMLAAVHHLEAAGVTSLQSLAPMHRIMEQQPAGNEGTVLKLLIKYLQWFMSGVTGPVAPATTTTADTTISSSSSSNRLRRMYIVLHGSSGSRGSSSTTNRPNHACMTAMCACLEAVFVYLAAFSQEVEAGKRQGQAVYPQLVDADTGTFSILGRAIDLVLHYPADTAQQQMRRYMSLLGIWSDASSLAIRSTSNPSSNFRGKLPTLARALPSVARLMHTYLQQSPQARGFFPGDIGLLTLQLRALAEGAATPPGQQSDAPTCTSTSSSTSSSSRRQGERQQQQQAVGQVPADVSDRPCSMQDSSALSHEDRAQVERLLWHAVGTATTAMQAHLRPRASPPAGSSSSSSSGSSGGGNSGGQTSSSTASTSKRKHSLLTPGAGYNLQLPPDIAMVIGEDASMALLHLADSHTPQQQLAQGAVAAFVGLQQHTAAPGATAQVGTESTTGLRAAPHIYKQPFTPAGYLCSLYAPAAVPGDSPHVLSSSSTSTSSSSSSSNSRNSSSGGGGGGGGGVTRDGSSARPTPGLTTPSSSSQPDATCELHTRAQLLAAAADTWLGVFEEKLRSPEFRGLLQQRICPPRVLAVGQALARFLLLLVRQLQGAPAGRRAAFLGSPACSIAHQVLSEFSSGLGLQLPLWDVLVRGGAADAAALQQERYGPDGWKLCALSGEAVVQQVLLPGLLLVPAPAGSSSPDGGRSCWQATTTSTTSSSSSSVVVHSSIGSNTGSLACSSENCSSAGPPACSSSGSGDSHSVQCGPPDTAEDASSAHGCEVMLSLNMPLVGSLTEGQLVPLQLVPHRALQLQPGCIPPPAAFFLVEQLLRSTPSVTGMHLAIQLLRGSTSLFLPPRDQPVGSREEALAELQRLAHCSLASSVVSTAMCGQPEAGEQWAPDLLLLASELASVAEQVAAALAGSSSSGGGGSDSGDASSSGSGSSNNGNYSSSSSINSSAHGGGWSLVASLAAAAAAGGYAAHVKGLEMCGASDGGPQAPAASSSSSSRQADMSDTKPGITTHSSGRATAECAGSTSAAAGLTGCQAGTCSVCLAALDMLAVLRRLEDGAVLPAEAWAGGIAASAQQPGNFLQVQLGKAFTALALRRPVPGVCGNIQCSRVRVAAAVGEVRGIKGTLCGGCRAAWYCCEECQRCARRAHNQGCGHRG